MATNAAVLFDRATSVEISAPHIFDIAAAAGALVGTALLDIGRTVPFAAPVAYAIGTVVALAQTGEAFQLRAALPNFHESQDTSVDLRISQHARSKDCNITSLISLLTLLTSSFGSKNVVRGRDEVCRSCARCRNCTDFGQGSRTAH